MVAVVLVYWAVASGSTRIRQVSTDRALEEALAALARVLAVVLAGALVTADDALCRRDSLLLLLVVMMMMVMPVPPFWNALDVVQRRPRMMRPVQRKRRSRPRGVEDRQLTARLAAAVDRTCLSHRRTCPR